MYKDININIDNNKKIKTNSIKIGNKYDNQIIRLLFKIPELYISDNRYVACYHEDDNISYIVPLDYDNSFIITSALTTHPGIWQLLYISTNREIVNGDIDNADTVIVSDVLILNIDDNFLNDPIIESGIDPNIRILYDDILSQLEYFETPEFIESITGPQGPDGTNGKDGYTPIRGIDYWTQSDINDIELYCSNYINTVIGPSLLLSQQIINGEVD